MQNEYVPAYQCPADHPMLYFKGYAPFGTDLPPGVEIREDESLWAIGISITGYQFYDDGKFVFFAGTATGFPYSSATNSVFDGTHTYQVVLHCTSNRCHGTDAVGPPPDCPGGAIDDRAPRARVAPAAGAGLAARLAARDPGARVGGNTIVATGNGTWVFGVPHRPNFIVALGSHETIIGGGRDDNLAARGQDVTIRAGGGNDVIYGGPGGTLVGGSGHDVLKDAKSNATVIVRSSGNEVAVTGRHDRVLCSRRLRGDVIYTGPSDTVGGACREDHARILPARKLRVPPLVGSTPSPSAVSGDGSNAHPFTAPCDDPQDADCTVSSFPARTLTRSMQNEYVPAYQCPADHPYLYYLGYAPFGTVLPPGVEIREDTALWAIGVSISGELTRSDATFSFYSGTATGFPYSSATNSLFDGTHTYQVVLHCTSDRCHGTSSIGRPPDCPGGAIDDRAPRARVATAAGAGSATRLAAPIRTRKSGGNAIFATRNATWGVRGSPPT